MTGQLCQACATVVLFHSGRWDRALGLCREVLAAQAATPHARAVASGVSGLVYALRGRPGRARPALLDSHATATRIELVPMQVLATWGLALLAEPSAAADLYRRVLVRVHETEERHYCVPVLQFAAPLFADLDAQGGPQPAHGRARARRRGDRTARTAGRAGPRTR